VYWTLQLAGWATYAIVAAVTLMPMFPASVIPRLLLIKCIRAALGLPSSDLLRRLYALLERRAAPRWIWVASVASAHVVLGAIWYLLFFAATSAWQPASAPPFRWADVPHQSIDFVLVLSTWSAVYFAIGHWRRAQAAKERAAEATYRAGQAQLAALQYQLNPHFLFNALNSIRSSILENPAKARDAVTRLSDLMRQSVYSAPSEWTTLGAELDWVHNYLALEQLRFEDRLDASLAIDESAVPCLVPRFLMQPLVENAITHGGRTSVGRLSVRISAARRGELLEIAIANTGRLSGPTHGTGIGIANLTTRLSLLDPTRNRLTLRQDGDWVRLGVIIGQPAPLDAR
jgi:two-component system, LytTR family, sensor kinase